MTYRTHEIKVRFSDKEFETLNKNVANTRMSREGYIRTILNRKRPVEIPPADYWSLVREVRALGNNLHQIAYKANALGLLDVPMFRHHAEHITAVADKLTAVCLPREDKG